MILKGVGIGRGVAVGPVLRMAEPLPEPKDEPRAASVSAEAENARVTKALAAVNADLNRRAQEAANGDEGTKQAAEILQAVAMFASDPALAANIAKMVDDGKTGERAVLEGFGQVEEMFRQIGGYQGERAADLHDVGQRVIAELMGRPAHQLGDHALAHVVQVGGALALVAADLAEHLLDLAEAFEHGAFAGLAVVDHLRDVRGERRIGGEHGHGLQDLGGLLGALVAVRGFLRAAVEVGVHRGERLGDARVLRFGAHRRGTRLVLRLRQRLSHTEHWAHGHATANAHTFENHLGTPSIPPIPAHASRTSRPRRTPAPGPRRDGTGIQ